LREPCRVSYSIGDIEYLDSPWIDVDGKFVHDVTPEDQHPLRTLIEDSPAQWPQVLQTRIVPGEGRPYAVDTVELPYDNPWKVPLFCGDHDFLRMAVPWFARFREMCGASRVWIREPERPVSPTGGDLHPACITH
jgi:hypothetical protein